MGKMSEVLSKYFGEERFKYYHPADLIADEHYLRHKISTNGKVIIIVGCQNGEVPVGLFSEAEELEKCIKSLLYGYW